MPSVLLATVSIDIDIDTDTVWIFPSFADHFRVGFFSLLFLENFFFAPDSDRREGVAPRSCGGGGGGGGGRRDAPLFFSFPVPVAVHRRLSGGAVDAIDAAAFVFVCLFVCLFVCWIVRWFRCRCGLVTEFCRRKIGWRAGRFADFFFRRRVVFSFSSCVPAKVARVPSFTEFYRIFFFVPSQPLGFGFVFVFWEVLLSLKKIYCSFYRRVKGYSAPRLDFPCSRWT